MICRHRRLSAHLTDHRQEGALLSRALHAWHDACPRCDHCSQRSYHASRPKLLLMSVCGLRVASDPDLCPPCCSTKGSASTMKGLQILWYSEQSRQMSRSARRSSDPVPLDSTVLNGPALRTLMKYADAFSPFSLREAFSQSLRHCL